MKTDNVLEYDTEEIVAADKNCLWHHLKPHKLLRCRNKW